MLDKAVVAIKANKAKALEQINAGSDGFLVGDTYPFCWNMGEWQARRQPQPLRPGKTWARTSVSARTTRAAVPKGCEVRPLDAADVPECEMLHQRVHGHPRTNELREALGSGSPVVNVRDGRIRAYMTAPMVWLANHGVSETEEDMQALLLGAASLSERPIAFLMPARQANLYRWCLDQGFRAVRPMTLMTMGDYSMPEGSYFPSVLY